MFDSGSALVKPICATYCARSVAALGGVENRISLEGHTDAAPYGNGDRGYSNWELSADRANASRRELVAAGMPTPSWAAWSAWRPATCWSRTPRGDEPAHHHHRTHARGRGAAAGQENHGIGGA